MSNHFSDEQISSYFDGESTPEERAEIERLLETSSEARREFDDYKKLSALLNNLPVESAPQNLPAIVSRKLGPVHSETAAASSPLEANQSRRSLWMIAGSLTAIAATLLIAVQQFDFGPNRQEQRELADFQLERPDFFDRQLSERTQPQAEEARQLVAESESDQILSRPSELNEALIAGEKSKATGTALPLSKRVLPSQSAPVAAAKPIVTSSSDTANLVQHSPRSPQSGKNDSGLIFENLQELKDADIGKIVTALEKTNEGITVVKLTVVDRRAGLKSLQVLLSRHKIPLDDKKGNKSDRDKKAEGKSRKDKNNSTQEKSERLVAVYVKATPLQIAAALGDLRNSDLFQKLHVRGPIQTAQLNNYSGRQVFSGASAVPGAASNSSLTTSGRRTGSPGISGSFRIQIGANQSAHSAGDSKSPVEATKPTDALQKSGVDAEKLADRRDATRKNEASTLKELDRISRQLELSLSPEILTELAQTTGQIGRNAIGSRSLGGITVRLNGKSLPSTRQNKNVTKVLKPNHLKVLFILVVNESGKSKVSPSAKPADSIKKVRSPKKSPGNGAA
ncbi:MAG: hypothetical protein IID46_01705 [Planctomycetes bacterium]|nr:hypothetical protein [Planctomycetota bacterium]